ncbi:hypothetical protein ACFLZZ_04775, partial [Nanoarchaeota archaeon]
MKRLIFISLLAILLSVSFVSAFEITPESSDYEVCRGSTTVVMAEVSGSGDFEASASGEAGLFTTTVPGSFSLDDGTKTVYSYVNPPSNTKVGRHVLELEVNDGNEILTEIVNIGVRDCQASTLEVVSEKTTCACEETVYPVTIKNNGLVTETFSLSVNGVASEWAEFSKEFITLDKGQESVIEATITPPCNVHGVYELEFESTGEKSSSSKAVSNLEINPCYEYKIGFEEESYSLCSNVEKDLVFSVENTGTSENTYSLTADLDWVSVPESFVVGAGEKKEVTLTAKPELETTEGTHTLRVSVLSETGDVGKTSNTDLIIEECFGVTVNFENSEETICDVSRDHSYPLTIINSGKGEDTVTLSVKGPSWADLDDESMTLVEEEKKVSNLNVNLPTDIESEKYGIEVTLTSKNGAEANAFLEVFIAEEDECYAGELTIEDDELAVGLEKGRTFDLMLKNTGYEEATYKISLDGEAETFSLVNPDKVTLKSGEEVELYLFISPPLS